MLGLWTWMATAIDHDYDAAKKKKHGPLEIPQPELTP
jgi:hypothetical protein